jgi:tRNA A-37 threonylcarbamoyl transferase component Bud32
MTGPLPLVHTVPGPLLGRGREAAIHELGPGRVLRRYDDGRDVTREVTVMRHVADHAFPVPRVHALHADADGRVTGIVLDRIDGPSLIEAAVTGRLTAADVGSTLAGLHDRLHRVPVADLPALPDVPERRPGDAVVHLDLHPANVMLAGDVPVVIDWAIARTAPATLDTAMTALTLAAAVVAGIPTDAGDVTRLVVPQSFLAEVLESYLGALAVPPTSSLDRAAAVLALIGAQPQSAIDAAVALVRRVLDAPGA